MRWCDTWRLLPQRIALHEPSATAVIADVHLGYAAARQRQGDAVPSRSVAEEMQPLIEAARATAIRRLLVAGDLFEAGFDADLYRQFAEVLADTRIEFLGLIPGNHDRGLDQGAVAPPVHTDGFDLATWRIVHGDQPIQHERAIMGHWHPALRLRGRKAPCFLARGTQLMLPAFSLDAAGVDVRKDSRWREWDCYWIDVNTLVPEKRNPGVRVARPWASAI